MKYFRLIVCLYVVLSINIVNAQNNALPSYILSDPPNPTEYREQSFDILHYELDAHFDNIPFRSINAVNSIIFVWDKNPQGKKFYFHLRDLVIDSILYNNQIISYQEIGTKADAEYHFEIEAPTNATLGDTVRLDIRYHGLMTAEAGSSSWGGVQTSSGSFYALGVGFKNNYVSMTQHWMPCFDHPSDKATFTGKFRAKKPFFVASNGSLTIENPSDTAPTYIWKHDLPVATYLMTFAVDNFISIPYETEYPSVVYTKQSDSVQTKYAFAQLPAMINCFENYFTNYPFEKIGFCITQLGAMEHQTMISYPRSLVFSTFNQKDSMNPVAAHELAHMWFGDLVTPLDFKHAWLTESFATFSEALWYEYKKSKIDYLNYQEKQANDYMNIYANAEGIFPIYNFVRTGTSSNYPRTIYEKGAVVVGMLRFILGDEAFFTSLKEYLNQYQYGNASTDDIIRIFQSHSTQDLEPFFNEWLFGKGFPIVEIDTTRNNETSFIVSIKQVQQPDWVKYTTLPINIGYFINNELVGDTVVYLTMNQQNYEIDNMPSNAQLRFNKGTKVRSLFRIKPKVTSTNDKSKQQGMLLVPNPANSMVSVVIPEQIEWSIIEVYSLLGEKVLSNPIANSKTITFSVESLPKGFYTVVVKNNSQSTVCKLAVE